MRLLVLLLQLWSLLCLVPMTEIEPTSVELEAFGATLTGALAKLKLKRKAGLVVHVVGASIESNVDWTKLCEKGVTIVLVGPRVNTIGSAAGADEEGEKKEKNSCVVAKVDGLYSHELLVKTLGPEHVAVSPSLVMLFNADVYMPYWRRTLAELLQLGKPVVVTMYCEFEGHKLQRLFKWQEVEFGQDAMEKADQAVATLFAKHAATHLPTTQASSRTAAPLLQVPQVKMLWEFQPNPHAHEPPKNCYNTEQHGVRNSYWIGFKGDTPTKRAKDGL